MPVILSSVGVCTLSCKVYKILCHRLKTSGEADCYERNKQLRAKQDRRLRRTSFWQREGKKSGTMELWKGSGNGSEGGQSAWKCEGDGKGEEQPILNIYIARRQ